MNYVDPTLELHANESVIYLAGGCFWGVEHMLSLIPGVKQATSGYANSNVVAPDYQTVKRQETTARETVRVVYDSTVVNLETIMYAYFYVIDPTVKNQQSHDIGTQYQTGVYYVDDMSRRVVKYLMKQEEKKYDVYCVECKSLENFYEAEEYHQQYLVKNPEGYCHIPFGMMKKAIVKQPCVDEALLEE